MIEDRMPPVWLILLLGVIAAAAIVVPFVIWLRRRDRGLATAGGPRLQFNPSDPDGKEYRPDIDRPGLVITAQPDHIYERQNRKSKTWSLSWPELQGLGDGYSFVIFRGPKRSGKTVLAHYFAIRRARRGDRVIVFDPDARPGMWPGCEVYGGGDNWPEVIRLMTEVSGEITARRESRTRGNRVFNGMTVVFSEGAALMRYGKPASRPLFEEMARRGEKIGISFFLDVQDTQAGTLDLEGATHLLHNADLVISVRKDASGDRWATVDQDTCQIPELPDPEALADEWAALRIPVPGEGEARPPQKPQDTGIERDTSTTAAEAPSGPQDAPETATKAAERQALALTRWAAGKPLSQNDIAALLGGNRNDQIARLKALRIDGQRAE